MRDSAAGLIARETTAIEWADYTFNPWEGCQKVSPGCDNCYAETRNHRFAGGANWGPGAPRRRTSVQNWNKPRRWNREAAAAGTRPFVFCASLADVFDNAVDPAWRADLFQLIRETPNLVWLLLTKRPQLVHKMVEQAGGLPPNVALGTSVVDGDEVHRNCGAILQTPGALFYFVSAEPLLDDIADKLQPWLENRERPILPPKGSTDPVRHERRRISWVIVGGESGANARPMSGAWVCRIRHVCEVEGAVFNFKQWGEWLAFPDSYPGFSRKPLAITVDGRTFRDDQVHVWLAFEVSARVGVDVSGHLLDGVAHLGRPGVPPAHTA